MTTSRKQIRVLMFGVTLALLAGIALTASAAQEQAGMLTVTGTVTVNGKPAATGDLIATGSEIKTAKGSSAVVSLGKLGRIEAQASTTILLRYDEKATTHTPASISILLREGLLKLSTDGITFNIETGVTSTRPKERTEATDLTVENNCGVTSVSVTKGNVEFRYGHTVKQIAAGGQDTAGQTKPGCTPSRNH
ncbi:MAG TPA: hypothetical protein VI306_02795 [Pyrinomonadaceae bacterium]